MSNDTTKFEYALKSYLSTETLHDLRKYAREIGVSEPTKLLKKDVVDAIVGVLSGKIPPISVSNRGAPVKNRHVDPRIVQEVEKIQLMHLSEISFMAKDQDEDSPYRHVRENLKNLGSDPFTLNFSDGSDPEPEEDLSTCERVFGQVAVINNVYMLLPLDCIPNQINIVLPDDVIRKNHLIEGDVIGALAKKSNSAYVVMRVTSVNNFRIEDAKREAFDSRIVDYPQQAITLYDTEKCNGLSAKYVDFLVPLYKGQRGVICGAPKAGASTLLHTVATSANELNKDLKVLVLLVDSAPEDIQYYRESFYKDDVVATSFEDEPERQVFAAEYLLKRAKSYAEFGYNVLLIVDSFTALAKAYNDTEASEGGKTFPCGLESKTLQYLKKFLASARNFKLNGSLTILGSASAQTGDPMDELICAEIVKICRYQILLSSEMAYRHQYPAIDPTQTYTQQTYRQLETSEALNGYLKTHTKEEFRALMQSVYSYKEFLQKLKL